MLGDVEEDGVGGWGAVFVLVDGVVFATFAGGKRWTQLLLGWFSGLLPPIL